MKVYLVRHGKANPAEIDPAKGLSDEGKADIIRLAESIKHLDIRVKEIIHSGKARAEQTAMLIASAIHSANDMKAKSGMKPDDPVERIGVEITTQGDDLMLVGHLPFMAKLSSYLLTGNPERCHLEFAAGGMACLEYDKGQWSLEWFISPEMLGK